MNEEMVDDLQYLLNDVLFKQNSMSMQQKKNRLDLFTMSIFVLHIFFPTECVVTESSMMATRAKLQSKSTYSLWRVATCTCTWVCAYCGQLHVHV